MDGISSTAAAGAMAAVDRLTQSAQRVADGSGDVATEVVDQAEAKAEFSANLAVMRTGDEMTKRLLDIKV